MDTTPDDPRLLRAQSRVGRVLREKWTLDRLLGVGGMAAVYAGTHRNGSRGAIKMLHLELSLEPEIHKRFLREGYLANSVGHPGVVRVLDDDVAEDGSVFLVMELLVGETLDARWDRSGRRLEPAEALRIADPVLSVLAVAHEKQVVHRDIKPENVFVCQDGSVKLLDFGIARLRDGVSAATQAGAAMGTPAFMAPEQALGESDRVGPRSDLWSLGATLFMLLTGQHVHRRATPGQQLVAAATCPAPSLASEAPLLPPGLVALVDRALAFDPEQRWADAAAMQRALREVYASLGGGPISAAPQLRVPDDAFAPSPTLPAPLIEGDTRRTGAPVATALSLAPTPRKAAAALSLVVIGAGLGFLTLRVLRPPPAPSIAPALAASPVAAASSPAPLPLPEASSSAPLPSPLPEASSSGAAAPGAVAPSPKGTEPLARSPSGGKPPAASRGVRPAPKADDDLDRR